MTAKSLNEFIMLSAFVVVALHGLLKSLGYICDTYGPVIRVYLMSAKLYFAAGSMQNMNLSSC